MSKVPKTTFAARTYGSAAGGVCNAQKSLTLAKRRRRLQNYEKPVTPMRNPAVPSSSLPSLMMPCPVCAGRMVYSARRPISAEVEDTVYACRNCGAELIRTSSVRAASRKSAEAA
jgi:hypothetical protein